MTAKEKNKLAGIFLLAHGGFVGLIYLLMFGLFAFILLTAPEAPTGFFAIITFVLAIFSTVFVAPQIIGGWKILKERPDARNWGIAASVFACLNAPIGTAAGVFALIFLLGDEGREFYDGQANPSLLNEANLFTEFTFENSREKQPHGWK